MSCPGTCTICLGDLENAVELTTCSHKFCAGCLINLLRSQIRKCPNCRVKITMNIYLVLKQGQRFAERINEKRQNNLLAQTHPHPVCNTLPEVCLTHQFLDSPSDGKRAEEID